MPKWRAPLPRCVARRALQVQWLHEDAGTVRADRERLAMALSNLLLNAIDFASLPVKDAITIVRGNGKRKLAVFEDPNCGYCKRFERDLAKIDNVTVYLFLMPVLGPGSVEKSRNVWCAKDPAAAWTQLMQKDIAPTPAQCNTAAIDRNLDFGRRYKITGTPTLIAQDGSRVPGAINAAQIEKLLADASKTSSQ